MTLPVIEAELIQSRCVCVEVEGETGAEETDVLNRTAGKFLRWTSMPQVPGLDLNIGSCCRNVDPELMVSRRECPTEQ
jgi:hypothetical protein